jgi:hypothetical protein
LALIGLGSFRAKGLGSGLGATLAPMSDDEDGIFEPAGGYVVSTRRSW